MTPDQEKFWKIRSQPYEHGCYNCIHLPKPVAPGSICQKCLISGINLNWEWKGK